MKEHVQIDPNICHGKPVIRGTRVPVSVVVGSIGGGMTSREVEREYDLSSDDVQAAVLYATSSKLDD